MLICIVLIIMFFTGLLVFSLNRKHMLLMLLSLEYTIVALFLLLFMFLNVYEDYYFSLVFLVMSVCESALGLAVLVSMIRGHGNDFMVSFNSLW
uniref:NADH-ubiquinone oxidoreductase chain 4L n=1 Tax=Cyrtotrachelus buqueti TaxID=1892066 RepID=A0A346T608_9CUCU|nr:NADH dehydrogenase subunit 4L [Cyrtotrachelus buqueti]AXU05691.1 NADH dehydrogenase subunit 4L [Cyrtotrachelus buqueti]